EYITVPSDNLWLISSQIAGVTPQHQSGSGFSCFINQISKNFTISIRIMIRFILLFTCCLPLLVMYPLLHGTKSMRQLWYYFAVRMLQAAGPTLIKLGQWASTRRDLFSEEFCDQLSVLHNSVSAVGWSCSTEAIDKMFEGKQWQSFIYDIVEKPIGSGCIAQVYKAKMDIKAFESCTGTKIEGFEDENVVEIAIKVAKKNIRELIMIDMAILKFLAGVFETIVPSLFFVNLLSSLQQFGIVLERQVDLRNEAKALQRFSKNFNSETTHVIFPKVYAYSDDVIIESFEDGIPVNQLIAQKNQNTLCRNASLKRRVALIGVQALLKMIFLDNFLHGDLHPGNILVRIILKIVQCNNFNTEFFQLYENFKNKYTRHLQPRIRLVNAVEYECDPKLVLLDTGIAIEQTERNLDNLRLLFTAVVEKRGYDVGKLLVENAPRISCTNVDEFYSEIEQIVSIARSSNLAKLDISRLLGKLFSIVSRYQVGLETSFATVVLSVMVLEGLGRSLDPDLDLFQCAYPFLSKAFNKNSLLFLID
uniref:ABC1 domain-containing protein n=1 Tax=Syphacia muris TaxID=451379 RepID=A0A0N5AMW8_9BILA